MIAGSFRFGFSVRIGSSQNKAVGSIFLFVGLFHLAELGLLSLLTGVFRRLDSFTFVW